MEYFQGVLVVTDAVEHVAQTVVIQQGLLGLALVRQGDDALFGKGGDNQNVLVGYG